MKVLILTLLAVVAVLGDLPVHCPHHKLKGTWKFHLGRADEEKGVQCVDASSQMEVCNYGSCFTSKVLGAPNYQVVKVLNVKLEDENVAIDLDSKKEGTWTAVYDEGIEVHLDGRTYFAFSKFKDGNGGNNAENSVCSKTFPGWHNGNPDEKEWGCFHGEQIKGGHESLIEVTDSGEASGKLRVSKHAMSYDDGLSVRSIKYKSHQDYIKKIEQKAKTWTAAHYPELEGMSLLEIHQRMGSAQLKHGAHLHQHHRHHLSSRDMSEDDYAELLGLMEKEGLPKNWDWRDVDGQNYVDEVVSQICGSCYAASTTSMINSRLRIATKGRHRSQLDYKQVLDCDRYNQGCAGGYPYLVEKFAHDFGFTETGQCSAGVSSVLLERAVVKGHVPVMRKEKHKRHRLSSMLEAGAGKAEAEEVMESQVRSADVRVKLYNYVGDYYGGSTALKMMKEIKNYGPITVGIGGSLELMHYKAGVFHHTGAEHDEWDFAPVSHAVVIVGWGLGKDSGKLHWIVKNSYGKSWGENGFFRIGIEKDGKGEQHVNTLTSWGSPVQGDSSFFLKMEKKTN